MPSARARTLSSQNNAGLIPLIRLLAASGGAGGGALPLVRTRWIDGLTIVPAIDQTGAETAPFSSPQAWLNNAAVFPVQPASLDDANTLEMGLTSPAPNDAWLPTPQVWTIPANRNIAVRAPYDGTSAQNATFTTVTLGWANIAPTNPAFTPALAALTLDNLSIGALTATITDGAGAAPSLLIFSGQNAVVAGSLNVAGSTFFNALEVTNGATVTLSAVTNPGGGPTFSTIVTGGSVLNTTNLTTKRMSAVGSTVHDTGTITSTTNGQSYSGCIINAVGLTDTTGGAFGVKLSFQNCTFTRATLLTAAVQEALFDGDSWVAFLAAGGTLSATTVAVVQGGFANGIVPGVNVASPAGNAATLAVTGQGATAAWATGGNHYVVPTLAGNTTITLADGAAAGALAGTVINILRTDTSGNSLTVNDATAGALATIPSSGFATFRSNGTAWALLQLG